MDALSAEVVGFILEVAVKATALLVVVAGVARRWRTAAGRALLWNALLAGLLCLPMVAAWQLGPAVDWDAGEAVVSSLAPVSTPEAEFLSGNVSSGVPWATLILGVYLAGVALRAIRVGIALQGARQLGLDARPLDGVRLEYWRRRLGIEGQVEWAASSEVTTPSLVGWMRPLVLVPERGGSLDDAVLNAALAHELSHVRRRDHLWNLVGLAVICLYWFHPLVYVVRRWWQEDSECACDDWAVQLMGDARGYSRVLAEFAAGPWRPVPLVLDMARGGSVLRRVDRLLRDSQAAPQPHVGLIRTLCAVGAVALLCGCLGGAHRARSTVIAEVLTDQLVSSRSRAPIRTTPYSAPLGGAQS
ncbi:M56 family metallopeptidase [Candidatus Latescibacterota bacterium]